MPQICQDWELRLLHMAACSADWVIGLIVSSSALWVQKMKELYSFQGAFEEPSGFHSPVVFLQSTSSNIYCSVMQQLSKFIFLFTEISDALNTSQMPDLLPQPVPFLLPLCQLSSGKSWTTVLLSHLGSYEHNTHTVMGSSLPAGDNDPAPKSWFRVCFLGLLLALTLVV